MANQIQKKFILDGAVDGLKIKLLKDQALVGTLQDGSSVDLIKLDGSDKVLVKGVEVGLKSEIDQSLVDAKAYADQKITDLVNGADVALDTLKEIGDQLASDQNAVSALVTTVANNLTEAKGYADTVSAQALVDAKAYTDAEIAAIPAVDISGKADKSYVDEQDGALSDRITTLEQKHPIDLSADVTNVLPAANGGTGRTDFPAMQMLFGAPDGLSIDRSEFLTYDASIGLLINQGGQMQTRSLEQNATDPSAVIVHDKIEVIGDNGTGQSFTRIKQDYLEAKKVLSNKELSASVGFDGVDSWLGVSETSNAGNNISMAKIFPNKAQLFTVDIVEGNGPQAILPVENYDLTVKKYVDDQDAQVLIDAKAYTDAEIAAIPPVDLSNIEADISTLQGQVSTIEGEISTLQSNVSALQSAKVLTFEKELFTAVAPLTDISLAHQAVEKSLVVFVGRLALHAGEDYTVSVVGGVTKLTWAGDFAVGGVEGIEAGDKIKVTYAYLA